MKTRCKDKDGNTMSVAHEISALALINVKDIFSYMITAKDAEICERYVTEERAVDVAEKYMEIAMKASALEVFINGWSMTYTQPIKDSDERREYTAMFYDRRVDE